MESSWIGNHLFFGSYYTNSFQCYRQYRRNECVCGVGGELSPRVCLHWRTVGANVGIFFFLIFDCHMKMVDMMFFLKVGAKNYVVFSASPTPSRCWYRETV